MIQAHQVYIVGHNHKVRFIKGGQTSFWPPTSEFGPVSPPGSASEDTYHADAQLEKQLPTPNQRLGFSNRLRVYGRSLDRHALDVRGSPAASEFCSHYDPAASSSYSLTFIY